MATRNRCGTWFRILGGALAAVGLSSCHTAGARATTPGMARDAASSMGGAQGARHVSPAAAALIALGEAPRPAAEVALRDALLAAPPPVGDEGVDAWLSRLRRTAPDTVWAAAAARAQAVLQGPAAKAAPVRVPAQVHTRRARSAAHVLRGIALGVWARRRLTTRRETSLAAVVRHETINRVPLGFHEEPIAPGRAPAFEALAGTLHGEAAARGLNMHTTDHVVHHMRADLEGIAPLCASPAIMVHVDDVQFVGDISWGEPDAAPRSLAVVGDKLVGRGALDDKGPLVAAMDALDALRGVPGEALQPTLIIGTGEELGTTDVSTFLAHHDAPEMTVIPTMDFDTQLSLGEYGNASLELELAGLPSPGPDGGVRLDLFTGDGQESKAMLTGVTHADCKAALAPLLRAQPDLGVRCVDAPDARQAEEALAWTLRGTGAAPTGTAEAPGPARSAILDLLYVLRHADFGLRPSRCLAVAGAVSDLLGRGTDVPWLQRTRHPDFEPPTMRVRSAGGSIHGCNVQMDVYWPPGLSRAEVLKLTAAALKRRLPAAHHDVVRQLDAAGTEPVDAGGWAMTRILTESYARVVGQPKRPRPMWPTRPTAAGAFPRAVVFGPLSDGTTKRVRRQAEHITREELSNLVEVLTTALYLYRPDEPPACLREKRDPHGGPPLASPDSPR